MITTDIDREIEILNYNINDLEKKINNMKKFGVSNNKILKLEILKSNYQKQLAEML